VSTRSFQPTSTTGSEQRSPSAVRTLAVVTHGKPETIGPAFERLRKLAAAAGIELLVEEEEAQKHGVAQSAGGVEANLAVVLGGDGTMLRALHRLLDTGVPVIGVNFGRVGFLASIGADDLEEGLRRAFAGEYRVVELPTLEVSADAEHATALNDVVVLSSVRGRMVELQWALGGEDLGVQPCDGMICATATGSTAYNLSNGGPVLVRGLDAMVTTFIAAHSLHARPMVVPRGLELVIRNQTPDVPASVIADGHGFAEVEGDAPISIRLGDRKSLLATLPEATFFRRYRETFGS
jgi:NAD+ kinase